MEKDSLVFYDIEISTQNQERKYYALTEKGKNFYLSNRNYYIKSLHLLQIMIGDDYENRISNNKKKSKKWVKKQEDYRWKNRWRVYSNLFWWL